MDRRITNGLAWAGVFLVVGIPTADFLSAQFLGDPRADLAAVSIEAPVPAAASQRPSAQVKPAQSAQPAQDPEVATVTSPQPAAAKPGSGNAVDGYLQSGRPLPSYITGGGAEKPSTPPAAATAPTARPQPAAPAAAVDTASARETIVVDPVEVSSIPPKVAPTPMPLSMRPEPVQTATVPSQSPLIIDQPQGQQPVVPSRRDDIIMPPANVTSADLEDWETGPLSDFLADRQRGGQPESDRRVYQDDQGYYYEEEPQRDRLLGPAGLDQFLFGFPGY